MTKELFVVGFAPSWQETPWDTPNADFWGMNNLHKLAPDKPWTAWFQLHDVTTHHANDPEHLQWLAESQIPVWMFQEHLEKFPIPRGVAYPVDSMVQQFGNYFTNTVSWCLALAIASGAYHKVSVYGIDMAQDSEYGNQRPSCEYFLGIALGRGMEIYVPPSADLLKTPFLYGMEDEKAEMMVAKYNARIADLDQRVQGHQNQINQLTMQMHQMLGAKEDSVYWRTRWTSPTMETVP